MQTSRRRALWHAAAFGSLFFLILWSQTRSSWVGMTAGLGTYALLVRRLDGRQARWILGGAAFVLGLGLLLPPTRALIVARAQSFTLRNQDIQHRLGSLPVIQALRDRPLFGAGYGNYPAVYRRYYQGPFSTIDTPDNQYFRWLIENGLVGAGLFLAFLIGLPYACWVRLRAIVDPEEQGFYGALLAGWVAIAVTFLFFDGFYWTGPNMTFWGFLGLLATGLGTQAALTPRSDPPIS
jgi:O-antigen ligase